MSDVFTVVISPNVLKILRTLPKHIVIKLMAWVDDVEEEGLSQIKKIPGFHDEALSGNRFGQRSIRLNKAYRAIYTINNYNQIEFIQIIEVHKHEY